MSDRPVLIGCAHGTRSRTGQETIRTVLDMVRAADPELDVREAYVDVHGPFLSEVVSDLSLREGRSAVVVPLLLAGGYHVYHDIAQAIASHDEVHAAPALGPDQRLIDIVMERLREARVPREATLVLAAAGSSDPRSQADTAQMAEMLRVSWGGPVRLGFAAGHEPSVADTVRAARDFGEDDTVAVASLLLAPGVFQDRLAEAGADIVTAPLAPHPDIVSIVLERYADVLNER